MDNNPKDHVDDDAKKDDLGVKVAIAVIVIGFMMGGALFYLTNRTGFLVSRHTDPPSKVAMTPTSISVTGTSVDVVEAAPKLAMPSIKSILASEDGSITIEWDAVNSAKSYEVQRAIKGSGAFETIGKVNSTMYRDVPGAPGTTFEYRVAALSGSGKSDYCGAWEKTARKMPQKIAYVGDSVMSGFSVYGLLTDPREQSFAAVSRRMATLNQQDLPSVIAYAPDRAYFMVGTNDCVGNISDSQIEAMMIDYYDMVDKLHASNPTIEIVIMGIGPTRSDKVNNDTVQRFNNRLMRMVGEREFLYYYDTGKVLRDEQGMLRSDYAAGDGIHWSKAAYDVVYADLKSYVMSW